MYWKSSMTSSEGRAPAGFMVTLVGVTVTTTGTVATRAPLSLNREKK